MEIRKNQEGDMTVYRLNGTLDSNTSPGVEKEILNGVEENPKIILDMSETRYVSSAGLRVILVVYKFTSKRGGLLQIRNPNPMARELFEMTGVDSFLNII